MTIADVAARAEFRADKMGKADLVRTDALLAGLNCLEPGQRHSLHSHAGQDKLYYIVAGRAEVTVGEGTSSLGPGALVLARSGEPHALANPGPERLIALVVMAPPPAAK